MAKGSRCGFFGGGDSENPAKLGKDKPRAEHCRACTVQYCISRRVTVLVRGIDSLGTPYNLACLDEDEVGLVTQRVTLDEPHHLPSNGEAYGAFPE